MCYDSTMRRSGSIVSVLGFMLSVGQIVWALVSEDVLTTILGLEFSSRGLVISLERGSVDMRVGAHPSQPEVAGTSLPIQVTPFWRPAT